MLRRVVRVPGGHLGEGGVEREVEVGDALERDAERRVLGSRGVEGGVHEASQRLVLGVDAVEVRPHRARAVVKTAAQGEVHAALDVPPRADVRGGPARLVRHLARQRVVDGARGIAAPGHRVRLAQVGVRVHERGPEHGAARVQGRVVTRLGVRPGPGGRGEARDGDEAARDPDVARHDALGVRGRAERLVREARARDANATQEHRPLGPARERGERGVAGEHREGGGGGGGGGGVDAGAREARGGTPARGALTTRVRSAIRRRKRPPGDDACSSPGLTPVQFARGPFGRC